MNKNEAYDYIVREYLHKCSCCDECISEYYCIENQLKKSRVPQEDCMDKIKDYLRSRN